MIRPIVFNFCFVATIAVIAFGSCKKEVRQIQDITAPSPMRCAPQLSDAAWYDLKTPAPLFEGMDILSYPVTTSSTEAQKYFNQGLLLAYGFNHAEAARSFYQAIRLDSTCAMCYWGFSFVLGPNYNAGMDPGHYERAYSAIQKAKSLSGKCTPKEKALIDAMARRYTLTPPDDRGDLDSAFMEAMKVIHHTYPEDVDVAAIYAESLMDMHPWDLWDKEGNAKPWTPEIIKAIEQAIRINPKHPGGYHFYIHALEASANPEKALASAKMFDDGLVARSGHLVHMPSHIYINTGDYHLGSVANINALKQDSMYVTQCHAQGAYPLAYYPHNYHFLAATATLQGRSDWAIDAAERMADHVNHKGMLIPELATLQHYYSIPYFVYVKFAKWDQILKMPEVDTSLLYPKAIRHYARGMAYLNTNNLSSARAELDALQIIAKEDTLQKLTIWEINTLASVVDIAQKVLEGEILASQGKWNESIVLLEKAIEVEDALNYDEPPDWFFSVRHHLGPVMLQAGQNKEAIQLYETDLMTFPKNGWALSGLIKALRADKQDAKIPEVETRFKEAWAHADTKLDGSEVE